MYSNHRFGFSREATGKTLTLLKQKYSITRPRLMVSRACFKFRRHVLQQKWNFLLFGNPRRCFGIFARHRVVTFFEGKLRAVFNCEGNAPRAISATCWQNAASMERGIPIEGALTEPPRRLAAGAGLPAQLDLSSPLVWSASSCVVLSRPAPYLPGGLLAAQTSAAPFRPFVGRAHVASFIAEAYVAVDAEVRYIVCTVPEHSNMVTWFGWLHRWNSITICDTMNWCWCSCCTPSSPVRKERKRERETALINDFFVYWGFSLWAQRRNYFFALLQNT